MNKNTLAFDIDGVIADFFGPFLVHVNQLLGTDYGYADCTSHNLSDTFNTSEQRMSEILKAYETSEIIAGLPPLERAVESLELLSEGYEIAIVTSRKQVWEQATEEWFLRYFPPVTIYYAAGRNNPFAGGSDRLHKPQLAELVGAVCLVEDNEQEFIHWDSAVVEPICFAQPWNSCLAASHPDLARLDWDGIVRRFAS